MLRAGALLALWAMSGQVPAAELPPSACAAPAYSVEAMRYEMAGTARISVKRNASGRAADSKLLQSSGYRLLDQASMALLSTCQFAPPPPGEGDADVLTVVWRLPDATSAQTRPEILPATCTRGYKVLKVLGAAEPGANLTVRVQVWPNGQAYTPVIEQSSGEEMVDKAALEVVENCQFSPGKRAGQALRSATLVALKYDATALAEDKIQRVYDQLAASYKAKEFKIRHIVLPTEAAANAVLAELNNGAQFGALAREKSKQERTAKAEGEVGWVPAEMNIPVLMDALAAFGKLGLLPTPVKTHYGWQVVEIEAERPRAAPPLDGEVRRFIRKKLMTEREVIVQMPTMPPASQ